MFVISTTRVPAGWQAVKCEMSACCVLVFAVLVSFFGYLYFLISFPNPSGDTNKAVYIIQLFHLLGLCSAVYIEKLRKKNILAYFSILSVLFLVFIHNLSSMMSHFPMISIF